MKALFVIVAMLICAGVQAHPGAVNQSGCHDSKKIGFHCHPERFAGAHPGGSIESPGARDKRLRRECKGRPDAGACLGYGRK